MRTSDAARLAEYRNDEEIARYQDWPMPYSEADALATLAPQDALDDVARGMWVNLAIELDTADGPVVVGDVAVGMIDEGTAHIGYTLAPEHHGRGYASEAVEAVIDALFERADVHRIVASLDPDNAASMRLIEQLGFTYEGLARSALNVRDEWVDDMHFGLLRDQRAAWRSRIRSRPAVVRLVEIGPGEAGRWSKVESHRFQQVFVASVLESFADARHPEIVDGAPLLPWYRGIEADGDRVGFVMMSDVTDAHPHPFLWRLVIDRWHQRRGIASTALRQLIDLLRARGCTQLLVSYIEAPGGPEPLYRQLGFVPNGEYDDDETVAVLTL
jgi:RimJ/RimL family protein N-acetyltransferase